MKKYIFSFIFILAFYGSAFSQDVAGEVITAIRSANAQALSKNFNDNVDLKILDREDVYSRSQAELMIKDFFVKHPVKSFSVAHKSSPKNGAEYTIGTLETTSGKFRIYFLLKKNAEKMVVQQFRIEPDNE